MSVYSWLWNCGKGVTLREEFRQSTRLTPGRTLEIFQGVCEGVGAAHARGLVHRDLKPENIFVSKPNVLEVVKITNFGIAKNLADFANGSNA